MSSDPQEICAACTRPEKDHGQNCAGHWLKCFLCGERSIDVCTRDGQGSSIWSCDQCRNTMINMREVVRKCRPSPAPTPASNGSEAEPTAEDLAKMEQLEADRKKWRSVVAERNGQIREAKRAVHELSERDAQLKEAETELRILRSQLQNIQQYQASAAAMMSQGYDQSAWGQQR